MQVLCPKVSELPKVTSFYAPKLAWDLKSLGDSVIPQFSLILINVFFVPYFCFLNYPPSLGVVTMITPT